MSKRDGGPAFPGVPSEIEELQALIDGTRHWNHGAGLIVPPRLARRLRDLGIEDGYTVSASRLPALAQVEQS